MAEELDEFIDLESKDGVIVTVSRDIACQSKAISCALDILGPLEGLSMPLKTIDGHTLQLIVEFLQLTEHLPPLNGFGTGRQLPSLDRAFFDGVQTSDVVNLIVAADYYGIHRLCDAGCTYVLNGFAGCPNAVTDLIINAKLEMKKRIEEEERNQGDASGGQSADEEDGGEDDSCGERMSGYEAGPSEFEDEFSEEYISGGDSTEEESSDEEVNAPDNSLDGEPNDRGNEPGEDSSEDNSPGENSNGEEANAPDNSLDGESNGVGRGSGDDSSEDGTGEEEADRQFPEHPCGEVNGGSGSESWGCGVDSSGDGKEGPAPSA